jgi:hypothetical protein
MTPPDAREIRRRELRRRLSVKHAPLTWLPEPVPLMHGCKIKVLGGTAEALSAFAGLDLPAHH